MNRRLFAGIRNLSVLVTLALFIIMFGLGSIAFPGFFSFQNFLNLFIDNAYLLILAVGMTFVIISGGIDLSVGSMLALSGMVSSSLLEKAHMSPLFVIPIVLVMGTSLGLFMGYLIQTFDLPPFIITLAGLYLARGLCYVVSLFTIAVKNDFFQAMAHAQLTIVDGAFLSPGALIAIAVVLVGFFISRYTKFGRTVYAIGGSEQSAILMGLPVARTKILTYALERLLLGTGRDRVYVLYALGIRVERKRDGAGHHRDGRHWRDPADRRRGEPVRNRARRSGLRDHPGADRLPGHAQFLVDPYRDRVPRVRVLPLAAAVRIQEKSGGAGEHRQGAGRGGRGK